MSISSFRDDVSSQTTVDLRIGGQEAPQGLQSAALELGAVPTIGAHPNLFVRGLPLDWSEPEVTAVFQQFGQLTSIRLVRHGVTRHSLGYGFVRYVTVGEAEACIQGLDGTIAALGHTLQVKFADADAGPPSVGTASGHTRSDSCYARQLPATYGAQEVQQLFEPWGLVLDVKLFPSMDPFRGASAVVRMAATEAAERAIAGLNGMMPPGGVQPLTVRFAESAAEKAARLSRRERQQYQFGAPSALGGYSGLLGPDLSPDNLHQALAYLQFSSPMPVASMPGAQLGPVTTGSDMAKMAAGSHMVAESSVCIKGLPADADRLWVYERFACFGPIVGLRIFMDEASGLCSGTGVVDYSSVDGGLKAQRAMNGLSDGDRRLQVVLEQGSRLSRPSAWN